MNSTIATAKVGIAILKLDGFGMDGFFQGRSISV
jgi:hypothetical protein